MLSCSLNCLLSEPFEVLFNLRYAYRVPKRLKVIMFYIGPNGKNPESHVIGHFNGCFMKILDKKHKTPRSYNLKCNCLLALFEVFFDLRPANRVSKRLKVTLFYSKTMTECLSLMEASFVDNYRTTN